MTEQELCAIEQRLLGEYKPIDVGDAIEVLDWSMKPIAKGLVTFKQGMYVWLDNDDPASKAGIHVSSICRDEPTQDEDVRALLDEVRRLQKESEG